jgi:Mg2+ and Co2+ transporter CorA
MWGMNVPVPGQVGTTEGLAWFFGILGIMIFSAVATMLLIQRIIQD